MVDLKSKYVARQGSVCTNSKKNASAYIERSLSLDEKELFINCEIRIKEVK